MSGTDAERPAVCPLMAEALTRDYMRELVEVPA